tara:strand:- start:1667 stop:1870 length:204 start_codon:yes stop_codon:yes gene_type:complete
MIKTILLTVLLMNDGTYVTSAKEVEACPSKPEVEAKFETLKEQGVFHDYIAWCFIAKFDPKKPDVGA